MSRIGNAKRLEENQRGDRKRQGNTVKSRYRKVPIVEPVNLTMPKKKKAK